MEGTSGSRISSSWGVRVLGEGGWQEEGALREEPRQGTGIIAKLLKMPVPAVQKPRARGLGMHGRLVEPPAAVVQRQVGGRPPARTLMRHRNLRVTPRMYSLGCCRLLRRFWQIRICGGRRVREQGKRGGRLRALLSPWMRLAFLRRAFCCLIPFTVITRCPPHSLRAPHHLWQHFPGGVRLLDGLLRGRRGWAKSTRGQNGYWKQPG